jgi:tetratricopeptide (TPR) repeat protein
LSDFGQHVPADALLTGIFCALLLSLARMGRKHELNRGIVETHRASAPLRLAALVCISGVWAWALLGANSVRLAEAHWDKAHAIEQTLINEDRQGSDEEYLDLISNAAVAADYQPDNVKYRHWLNVYRWQSISGLSDPNTGEVVLPDHTMETVRTIANELHDSRLLCPTYGPIYCVLGQIERSVLEDPAGADHIRKGFQLAPNDATVCFVAGLLEVEEGQIEAASAKLDRAVQLDGRFFRVVADIYVNFLERHDLAVTLAGESAHRLIHVVNLLAESDEHQVLAEQARHRVKELLESKCQEPDAPAGAFASLAKIYRIERDKEAAIEHYRRALVLDYGQIGWRLALTRLLAETNKIPEAIREARTCVRLGPQFKAAEKLLDDLSVLPGAVIGEDQAP